MKIKHVKIVDFVMEMLCVITVLSYLTIMLQVNVSEKEQIQPTGCQELRHRS